ncbi:MAG: hypothetical protein Q8K20_00305 [Gemmobacter sp.]|nr:hypothetical protein [Gemmobacter sp.]
MAMASILIGLITAIASFGAALVAGHGLALAFAFYILGGMAGVALALLTAGLRQAIHRVVSSDDGLSVARN